MTRTSRTLNRRTVLAGSAAAIAGAFSTTRSRAQSRALKVGVLLPTSGVQAVIGQDCMRAVDVGQSVLNDLGYPTLQIVPADTESNVEVSRSRAERLINDGADILIGAFDSGQSSAIAQVAEQKRVPFVINIAAAPQITEQGYKFVFRNFPTAQMIVADAFANQKEIFSAAGMSPTNVVMLHVNDTFGVAMQNSVRAMMPAFDMPYKIIETIAYDPAARELSVEIARAKGADAHALLVVSRLNDAILLTREMIKQRWTPQAILSMGPGWLEEQYLKSLGKLSDGPLSFVPWYDPHKSTSKVLEAAMVKRYPGLNLNTNHVYTFEALLIAADAYKRTGVADIKLLTDAIRTTNIAENVTTGPGISFNAKGQNDKLKNSAIQNRNEKLLVVAPKSAAVATVAYPLKSFRSR